MAPLRLQTACIITREQYKYQPAADKLSLTLLQPSNTELYVMGDKPVFKNDFLKGVRLYLSTYLCWYAPT